MVGNIKIANILEKFNEVGNEVLIELREHGASTKKSSDPRKYGAQEAAHILGRSLPWLRDNSRHIEISGNGRRYYTLQDLWDLREAGGLIYQKPEGKKAIKKVVANFKGGVGKSTTVIHEAHYMATYKGMKVLVIDLDPQASTTFCISTMIPDLDVAHEDTIVDSLTSDVSLCADIFRGTYIPGVDFIPANLSLQALDMMLLNADDENIDRLGPIHTRLDSVLKLVDEHYDLILIDCPPNMGMVTANAITAANAMTLPIPPALYDVGSAILFNKTISQFLEQSGKELDYFKVLLTKHPESAASKRNESRIRQIFGDYVYGGSIVATTEFEKASENFTTVYDINREMTSKKVYERALESLNEVHEEMFADYQSLMGNE
ncbi:putative replication protein A [Vibrio coralliirubri]|uniref:AAA family ATPase n=1 Tax=Vibrio coralliirubri TaxID=1516159 RepID=UPI00062F37B8|nr:AAA family ATPase [Vibrio coralliirubri]CDT53799.1 putative replication protein A [Vibrio coralliirubri]